MEFKITKIYSFAEKEWKDAKFEDIKRGDRFRLFSPDGVQDSEYDHCLAMEDAYPMEDGNAKVKCDLICHAIEE